MFKGLTQGFCMAVCSLACLLAGVASAQQGGAHSAIPSAAPHLAFDDYEGYVCGEGMCGVVRDGKLGFVDASGRLVVDFQFPFSKAARATPRFHEGACAVPVSAKDGGVAAAYIDKQGHRLFPALGELLEAYPFHNGVALIARAGASRRESTALSWQFIDRQGKPVGAVLTHAAPDTLLSAPEAWGGELPIAEGLLPFFSGANNRKGYVNAQGQWAIAPRFHDARPFYEGLAWVQDEASGAWGAIDAKGSLVIPFKHAREPQHFQDGLAAVVTEDNKLCYIDRTDRVRVACEYDADVHPFDNGHVLLSQEASGDKEFIVDKLGVAAPLPPGDRSAPASARRGEDGMYRVPKLAESTVLGAQHEVVGLMKSDGTMVLPPENFFSIGDFHDGLAYACYSPAQGDKPVWGFVNERFEFVLVRDSTAADQ